MIGTTILQYTILEKVGEGGMGVVYKAHDNKLDRLVALKFLPEKISITEEDKARFLQEARAASAVMHPNVCVIFDIAEHDHRQFIVMEYVDGVTLHQKIAASRTQIADCVGYAIQIAEALQEAHSKSVVHRDIKMDNIMVNSRNQVKVMDFGLAKLKGSLKLTRTSSTVGTLAYMAPEQIEGGEVDARSDIFSFGVVLYEMLTGHLPFRGEHEAAMVYSIVNEEPQPLQKYLPEAPSDLVHILNRLLEKEPDERYQSIGDVVIELRRLKKQTSRVSRVVPSAPPSEGSGVALEKPSEAVHVRLLGKKMLWPSIGAAVVVLAIIAWLVFRPGQQLPPGAVAKNKSIAVMYFENKTDEKDLDKILVEMLITNLGRNKEISVVSGQRLFDILKALGKQDAAVIDKSTASEVAKRAGVKTMLLGTIWKVGGKIDVPAQLLDVETGAVLNSDRVEVSKAEEVFSLADRLTDRVNEWLKVTATEPLHITDATTSSLEAYKHYEKGLQHAYRFELADAVKEFNDAANIDSTFAMAHFQSSFMRGMLTVFNTYPGITLGRARESLAKAKEHSNGLSEKQKQFIDCWEVWLRRDFAAAKVLTDALVAKYPDDKEAHWLQGHSELSAGRVGESVRAYEKAIDLDPSFSNAYNNLGYAYALSGDYEKAFSVMKTYLALIPDAYNGYDSGIEVYMMAGKFDMALKMADDGLRRNSSWVGCYNRQGQIFLLMGDPEKAKEKFRMFATQFPAGIESAQRAISMTLAFEGRIRESVDLIRQSVVRLKSNNDQLNMFSARFHLARLLLEQNKIDEALEEFEGVRALSEESRMGYNPWPVVCSYYSGLCYVRKGDFVRAEAKANEMREDLENRLHDSFYFAHYNGLKAEIQLAQNNGQAASSYLSKALSMVRKQFPRMRVLDSKTFASLGDETSALKVLDDTYDRVAAQGNVIGGEFLDFWLERSKLDYYKAKVYEQFGDKAEAIKFYQKALQNWKNADKDYPPYVEARQRLAALAKGN
jgi:tetratricopeptide (TPR) repeat protein/TolB-like protein/predicted Ser/Thr protein kinase